MLPVFASDKLSQAIQAYRQGNYVLAQQLLITPPESVKQKIRWTYYQAITAAQLGDNEAATQWYQTIIRDYPGTPEAKLSEQGLLALANAGNLDRPPGAADVTAAKTTDANNENHNNAELFQALMPLMFMNNGSGNGNNMNWMMMNQMMQSGNSGNSSQSPIDPAVLSNMITSQMMGQMDLGIGNQNEH